MHSDLDLRAYTHTKKAARFGQPFLYENQLLVVLVEVELVDISLVLVV